MIKAEAIGYGEGNGWTYVVHEQTDESDSSYWHREAFLNVESFLDSILERLGDSDRFVKVYQRIRYWDAVQERDIEKNVRVKKVTR